MESMNIDQETEDDIEAAEAAATLGALAQGGTATIYCIRGHTVVVLSSAHSKIESMKAVGPHYAC
jgi:hypothetical protein